MMKTIFYSWQNDLDQRVTRQLIREALVLAIKDPTDEMNLEDALRLDSDTQGVPGTPQIANTILNKIDQCFIFIPDLSFISKSDLGKMLPNPNVLIELGYAIKSKTDSNIICIMNEFFGSAENLPFDLKHKRWPIRFYLNPEVNKEDLKKERIKLSKSLRYAIKSILEAIPPISVELPLFVRMQPTWKSSSFLKDDDLLLQKTDDYNAHIKTNIYWKNKSQYFLRLVPTKNISNPLKFKELEDLCHQCQLKPLGFDVGYSIDINKYGSVAHFAEQKERSKKMIASAFTQVFSTGEIWGINAYDLSLNNDEKTLKIPYLYRAFITYLKKYLRSAKDFLHLDLPLTFIAGITDVDHYSIQLNYDIVGNCVLDEIIYEGSINNFDEDPELLLDPFFNKIWDAFGADRPSHL